MSVYRIDEIYEQLSLLARKRESYDGSKSFGYGRDEEKMNCILQKESSLLAELEKLKGSA